MNRFKKRLPEAAAFFALGVLSFAFRAPIHRVWTQVGPQLLAFLGRLPFGARRAVPQIQPEDDLTVANFGWAVGIENIVFDLGYAGQNPFQTALCEVFDSGGSLVLSQPLGTVAPGMNMRVQVNFQDDEQRDRAARLRVCSSAHKTQPQPPAPRPASKA